MPATGKGTVHDTDDEGVNNLIGYVEIQSMNSMQGTNGSVNYSGKTMYKPYLKKGNGANLQIGDQVTFAVKKASITVHGSPGVVSHIWILEIT